MKITVEIENSAELNGTLETAWELAAAICATQKALPTIVIRGKCGGMSMRGDTVAVPEMTITFAPKKAKAPARARGLIGFRSDK